jgi:hypothetical protein
MAATTARFDLKLDSSEKKIVERALRAQCTLVASAEGGATEGPPCLRNAR